MGKAKEQISGCLEIPTSRLLRINTGYALMVLRSCKHMLATTVEEGKEIEPVRQMKW